MSAAREYLDALGWAQKDDQYDRKLFLVIQELVREVERLELEIKDLRSDVGDALVNEGTLG